MSYSVSSTAHVASLPEALRFVKAFLIGAFVCTTIGCCWKYGLSFRVAVTKASATFSSGGYRVSASRRTWETKYTGFCYLPSSFTRAALTTFSVAARYSNRGSPGTGFAMRGGFAKYSFILSNAA